MESHHWSRPNLSSTSTPNDRPKRWRNSDSQIPEEKAIPASWFPSTITAPPRLKAFKLTVIPASRSRRVFVNYFLVSVASSYSRCRTALDRSVGLHMQIIHTLWRTISMNA